MALAPACHYLSRYGCTPGVPADHPEGGHSMADAKITITYCNA
ncbi:hypothetical protein DB31_4765 [Hyalangium minutum]|uniref:Uncharacterized protein n=1 Tax=Hyalangium minutum TaxID=394096 RepID=A0A085VZI9_9BACT|nr:hypothetical protein DB31_4765 [Hyalangium minutum]